MIILRNQFLSEADKIKYIGDCEKAFEQKLRYISQQIINRQGVRIVTLSGPSCSCKTTVVKKLVRDVSEAGKSIKIISIDDFFLSRITSREEALKKGEKIDFDSIDAIDFAYFCECCNRLFSGHKARLPVFDFVSATRTGYIECDPSDYDIIAFEGIQAIYPEIRAKLSEYGFMSIFINVEGPVQIGKEIFAGRDVRFARRMVRDYYFRNAKAEFTMFMWDSVTENEDKNMLPYAHLSDVRIDSFIPYELNMMKEPLEAILSTVPPEDRHYKQACAFRERFADIVPISRSYLPEDSMYREFLG
ncbi:MAG: hypothetical protein HFE78_01045 [Clostridiales bacterium]|nr:hypothetical protein [Clostridiales bacterium]